MIFILTCGEMTIRALNCEKASLRSSGDERIWVFRVCELMLRAALRSLDRPNANRHRPPVQLKGALDRRRILPREWPCVHMGRGDEEHEHREGPSLAAIVELVR